MAKIKKKKNLPANKIEIFGNLQSIRASSSDKIGHNRTKLEISDKAGQSGQNWTIRT